MFLPFYRWLGEAPAQRAKEEEQAEASVSGPEPAQWPFGLCTQQSVRMEPTDFPLKRKRRKYKAKLLATAAASIFWLTWTVPTPSHQTSPSCPPGHCYTITIKNNIMYDIRISTLYTCFTPPCCLSPCCDQPWVLLAPPHALPCGHFHQLNTLPIINGVLGYPAHWWKMKGQTETVEAEELSGQMVNGVGQQGCGGG